MSSVIFPKFCSGYSDIKLMITFVNLVLRVLFLLRKNITFYCALLIPQKDGQSSSKHVVVFCAITVPPGYFYSTYAIALCFRQWHTRFGTAVFFLIRSREPIHVVRWNLCTLVHCQLLTFQLESWYVLLYILKQQGGAQAVSSNRLEESL